MKEKIKVFEKITNLGYDTDKKILNMKIEDLIQLPNFNRSELTIAVGIKNALANKELVCFFCETKDNTK